MMLRNFYSFVRRRVLSNDRHKQSKVIYITEDSGWVIKRIGSRIIERLRVNGLRCLMDTRPELYFNALVHFGSIHTFSNNGYRIVHPSNKLIVTIYHGNYGISPQMDDTLNKLVDNQHRLNSIVISNSIMKNRLISWGIDSSRITFIPIGVDLPYFSPDASKRKITRGKLGIPDDVICIGSFQKDGVGWKEGNEPKLIKGPDIFVEVVKRLARKFKIHCLLTGPARGYVKRGLEASGINFTHRFLKNYQDIADFYNCLDLYLVTSREEGGPEALLESMASGVPVVSTRVGMSEDVIKNMQNGLKVEVEDIDGLTDYAVQVIKDGDLRKKIIQNGLTTVKNYDWDIITGQYLDLYRKNINDS